VLVDLLLFEDQEVIQEVIQDPEVTQDREVQLLVLVDWLPFEDQEVTRDQGADLEVAQDQEVIHTGGDGMADHQDQMEVVE